MVMSFGFEAKIFFISKFLMVFEMMAGLNPFYTNTSMIG
ncbi:hypothetical protein SLEP1_g22598 [Rubroshorea leprosula]|uniref:NADH dehydrogenase subunit 4L n=1 Tax=Rubroshorea leprosula TaxID=152421 RepID=A0AAV5J9N9_9ROSI|nr:hypothetical protein SLEP1_g22598 [Rubroshorea leprosula]